MRVLGPCAAAAILLVGCSTVTPSISPETAPVTFEASPSPEPTQEMCGDGPCDLFGPPATDTTCDPADPECLPPLPMTGPGSDVASADIAKYLDNCLQATESFSLATISFDPTPVLQLEVASQYRMAISEAAPTSIPEPLMLGLEDQGQLKVTCTIGARLVMADSDATVEPADWEQQLYLPPEPSVWVWTITPHESGTMTAALQVRPVIKVEGEDGSTYDSEYKTQTYPVVADVQMTLIDRITSFTEQVNVIAAAVVAVVGLFTALGVKKWRSIIKARREDETS